jgi:hypothetical protein
VCDQKSRSEKISSAAKQLDCLIKSSLDIDGLHSVNLFVLFVLYSFLFREALALIMYCCSLALCPNLRVNYVFVSSFVVV